ncbi:redoxin domain-containing protein [Halothiobacillus sp. DCM-1]|uniref:redoxin domain-containing protein n=1 Tax=Halothiobacillus sp. DCM-1 TaxID=3112558 RepID=UPI003247E404
MTNTAPQNPLPAARPRRKWWRWALELGIFIGALWAVRAYMAPAVPVAFTEAPIPAIAAPLVNQAGLMALADPRQPTLLVFWATWCGVCHVELPWIAGLAKTHRVVTIALDSGDSAAVRAYLAQAGLSDLPVINDPDGSLARQFGVTVTPTLLFLAPGGRVVTAETGLTSSWGIRLRLWYAGWHS